MSSAANSAAPKGLGFKASLKAFWDGFTQSSLLAIALMALAFAGMAVVFALGVNPVVLSGPLGQYVPRGTGDNEAFATIEAFKLAYRPDPADADKPHIYLIGNSIVAQAFASEPGMARDLQAATGEPWAAHMLTTPYQGPLDEAALADHATRNHPGVVVLSISFDRFGQSRDDYLRLNKMARLGLRSDWSDGQVAEILQQRPRRATGYYVADNRKFVMLNATSAGLRLLAQRPAVRRVDSYIRTDGTSDDAERYRGEILQHLRRAYKTDQLGLDLVRMTVTRLKERGARLVFFEVPMSSALFTDPADRQRYERFLAVSPKLVADLGGYYCRPSAADTPPAEAFPDYFHVADPAWQAKLRQVLARCVADMAAKQSLSRVAA